jgi:hypothetical protein
MSDNLQNAFVRIKAGATRQGVAVQNTIFKLMGHYGRDPNGGYVTVDGTGHDSLRNGKVRIYLNPVDYEMIDSGTGSAALTQSSAVTDLDTRSDAEISEELRETFEILAEMTQAVADNVVKGLIISGPAGIGKSHTVETTLDLGMGVSARLLSEQPKYDVVKGSLSAITLYCMLYRFSSEGSVLVLDDADGILYDEDALNVLKAALDTKKVRRIHWGTNSHILEKEGVPSSFEFKGGVIFISNIKFDKSKSPRIGNHLEALASRAHYLDLKIDSLREKIIHITNVVRHTDMLAEYGFSARDVQEVMDYVIDNVHRLNKVDLRAVLKCADIKKAMPSNWKKFADRSLCRAPG